MAVKSDVKTGHDIAYLTRGCAALGVSGTVQAEIAERLYQEGVGPGGERIIQHAAPKTGEDQAAAEAAAIARGTGRSTRSRPRARSAFW